MANSSKPAIRDSRKLGVAALALAVILFLAINLFSEAAVKGVQVDLTENKLFTLSDGTRETLGAVKEPITLRFSRRENWQKPHPVLQPMATGCRNCWSAM